MACETVTAASAPRPVPARPATGLRARRHATLPTARTVERLVDRACQPLVQRWVHDILDALRLLLQRPASRARRQRFLLLPPAAGRALRPRAAHGPSANHTTLSSAEVLAAVSALGASAMRIDVTAGHAVFIPRAGGTKSSRPRRHHRINYWWHGSASSCYSDMRRSSGTDARQCVRGGGRRRRMRPATCCVARLSWQCATRSRGSSRSQPRSRTPTQRVSLEVATP